jgi:hypothetical protein
MTMDKQSKPQQQWKSDNQPSPSREPQSGVAPARSSDIKNDRLSGDKR